MQIKCDCGDSWWPIVGLQCGAILNYVWGIRSKVLVIYSCICHILYSTILTFSRIGHEFLEASEAVQGINSIALHPLFRNSKGTQNMQQKGWKGVSWNRADARPRNVNNRI
jgi:hypothetical protein